MAADDTWIKMTRGAPRNINTFPYQWSLKLNWIRVCVTLSIQQMEAKEILKFITQRSDKHPLVIFSSWHKTNQIDLSSSKMFFFFFSTHSFCYKNPGLLYLRGRIYSRTMSSHMALKHIQRMCLEENKHVCLEENKHGYIPYSSPCKNDGSSIEGY